MEHHKKQSSGTVGNIILILIVFAFFAWCAIGIMPREEETSPNRTGSYYELGEGEGSSKYLTDDANDYDRKHEEWLKKQEDEEYSRRASDCAYYGYCD